MTMDKCLVDAIVYVWASHRDQKLSLLDIRQDSGMPGFPTWWDLEYAKRGLEGMFPDDFFDQPLEGASGVYRFSDYVHNDEAGTASWEVKKITGDALGWLNMLVYEQQRSRGVLLQVANRLGWHPEPDVSHWELVQWLAENIDTLPSQS